MSHPFPLSPPLPLPHCRSHHPSLRRIITCSGAGAGAGAFKQSQDDALLRRAADRSAGFTSPHPNLGCVITGGGSDEVSGEGFLYAQGTKCAELQAVEAAGELAGGGVAYLNLEPGDCYGDQTAVSALVQESHGLWWAFGSHFIICVGKPYNLLEVKVFKFMFWEKI